MSVSIKTIQAYWEFDSCGHSTIGAELFLVDGRKVSASIPNHFSPKPNVVYLETEKAVKYLNELIAPKLVGIDPLDYKKIDLWLQKIDDTPNKQVIGINTTLLVSILIYKAGALITNKPLYQYLNEVYAKNFQSEPIKRMPIPILTLINGASHGSLSLNFQEFSVVFSSSLDYSEAIKRGSELHQELEKVFHYRNVNAGLGHDGAYIPNLSSNFDALEIIKEALLKNSYQLGLDVFFALDITASFFYKGGKYYVSEEVGTADSKHLLELYEKIFKEYRFLLLEDPFSETDIEGWKEVVAKFGDRVYISGDDLLAANKTKMEKAVKDGLCSMANVKITMLPTIWQVLDFISACRKLSLKIILSQTAIETNDDFISDLAVATACDYVKFGPPVRGERVAKHNRLLAIEKQLFKK